MRRFSLNTTAAIGSNNSPPNLMSAWDWSKQFNAEDRSLGRNPLYLTKTELKLDVDKTNGPSTSASSCEDQVKLKEVYAKKLFNMFEGAVCNGQTVLRPVVSAPLMKFWCHCYLRWLTPIQIAAGGKPLEYLQQCIVVEEIICLQHHLESLQNSTPFIKSDRWKSQLIFSYNTPVTPNKSKYSELLTSSFPFSPGGVPSHVSFFGTPLSLFLENSLIVESDDDMDEQSEEGTINKEDTMNDTHKIQARTDSEEPKTVKKKGIIGFRKVFR